MSHSMLEDKFRKSFEEEENIYLVINELENFTTFITSLVYKNDFIDEFKIEFYLKDFLKSQNILYYFYKRHNLLPRVEEIIRPLRYLISTNTLFNPKETNIFEPVESLLKLLKEIDNQINGE